jgi:hypothetical protein
MQGPIFKKGPNWNRAKAPMFIRWLVRWNEFKASRAKCWSNIAWAFKPLRFNVARRRKKSAIANALRLKNKCCEPHRLASFLANPVACRADQFSPMRACLL